MSEDGRRTEIIAAVRAAMNQFGVRRLTVADVALQAGVSRQTVYEYFTGREALVEAALEAAGLELITAAEGRAPADAGPVERLAVLLEVVLAYFAASPLWSVEVKRAEFVPYVVSGGVFAAAAVAALDERMAGWWPDADPAVVARAADTLVRTLISHGLAPEPTPGAEVAQQLARVVSAAL